MTTKPTKKELKAVLSPYRKECEKFAKGLLTGFKSYAKPAPVEWRGLVITLELVRRSSVVCGVPLHYGAFVFWYYARTPEGAYVACGQGTADLIDNLFQHAKEKIDG